MGRRHARSLVLVLALAAGGRRAHGAAPPFRLSDWTRLRSAEINGSRPNPRRRSNVSLIVTLRSRHGLESEGLFKPREGIHDMRWVKTVPPITYVEREVATAQVALAIGAGDLVPPTIKRLFRGGEGSLQHLVGPVVDLEHAHEIGLRPEAGAQFDRSSAERMRVLDYLIGASDRAFTNVLLRADYDDPTRLRPVLVDHGQTFPIGPTEGVSHQFPVAWMASHTGPLLVSTRELIARIDPPRIARLLIRAGLEREAIVHTLRRLARLQRDPSFLEIREEDGGAKAMRKRMADLGRSPDQALPLPTLAGIDAVVDGAMRRVRQPRPPLRVDLYAEESVHLAELGGEGYDSIRKADHRRWLSREGVGRARRELERKLAFQLARFWPRDPRIVARYYAELCQRLLKYGISFGGPSRDVSDLEGHYQWALHAPLAAVHSEILVRLDVLFAVAR
jgi:hypothetical protein